jgi:hypothetical protein
MSPNSRILALCTVLTLAAGAFLPRMAIGQAPPAGEQPPPAPKTSPLLDPNPLKVDALNLRFHPPRGSRATAENLNGAFVITLSDGAKDPTWTMRIQSMKSSLTMPSPKAQIEDLLKELDRSAATYKPISNEARSVAGLAGQLCYIERTNKEGLQVISGWLVLPIDKTEFMVFAVQTLPEQFADIKIVFDASFNTIDLRTREQVLTERNAKLQNGADLLTGLTPEKLKALAGQKQWSRIYRPASASQPITEVGYALIEVLAAQRGALNPTRDAARYSAAEREEGLLVRVQGRYIIDAAKKSYYDSIALYWLAWDQSAEAWSLRGTHRQGDAEKSEAETGLRAAISAGAPRPVLSVIKSTTGTEPVTNDWEVPEVYLSQALGWIIGRLLPRDITQPREYAWYFYVASNMTPKVYQRVDRWERADDGTFVLTTHLTPETPPYSSVYQADGAFVRRMHGDGSITEPIELEQLRKLWKSKGLPVTADER